MGPETALPGCRFDGGGFFFEEGKRQTEPAAAFERLYLIYVVAAGIPKLVISDHGCLWA